MNRHILLLIILAICVPVVATDTDWETLDAEALELTQAGELDAAIEKSLDAITFARTTFGEEDARTATSMALLGEIHFFKGDYIESEKWLLSSLAIRERTLAPLDIYLEQNLNVLGRTYAAAGRADEARHHFERALALATGAAEAGLMGPEAPRWVDVLVTLLLLVDLQIDQEQLDDAGETLRKGIQAIELYGDDDPPYVYMYLISLFEKAMEIDAYDIAETVGAMRVELTRSAEEPLLVAEAELELARLNDYRDHVEDSATGYLRALEAAEQSMPADDVRLVRYLARAAVAAADLDQWEQVETLSRRALALAADDEDTVEALDLARTAEILATALERKGNLGEAEPLRHRTAEGYEQVYGTPSFMAAMGRFKLALNLEAQEKWQEAYAAYARTLDAVTDEDRLGGSHYGESLVGMLRCAFDQGDVDGVAESWARLLQLRTAFLGAESPYTIAGERTMDALKAMGATDVAAAAPSWPAVEPGAEPPFVVNRTMYIDPDVMYSVTEGSPGADAIHLQYRGELLAVEQQISSAAAEYEKALSIRLMHHGRDDEETVRAANRLAELYRIAGRPDLAEMTLNRLKG